MHQAGRAAIGMALAVVFAAVAGPGASQVDWRDDLKVLRIGFLSTEAPAADIARLEPFRAYLETRLSFPVELVPATTYEALIDAQVNGRTSYAIHSATSYAAAEAACQCLEPLVVPSALDGATGFYSILLVRADSPIQSLADAGGARLALTGEDSIAGRLVPMKAFAAEGIDPATFFSAIYSAPGPEAAITALFAGTADIAIGWSSLTGDPAAGYDFGVLTRMVVDGLLSMDTVRVVWQSRLIPFGPHAVRRDMPPELKAMLLAALTAMAGEAPDVLEKVDRSGFGGGGFVPANSIDYAVIAELVAPP